MGTVRNVCGFDIIRAREKGLWLLELKTHLLPELDVEPKNKRYDPEHNRGGKEYLGGVLAAFVLLPEKLTHTHSQFGRFASINIRFSLTLVFCVCLV